MFNELYVKPAGNAPPPIAVLAAASTSSMVLPLNVGPTALSISEPKPWSCTFNAPATNLSAVRVAAALGLMRRGRIRITKARRTILPKVRASEPQKINRAQEAFPLCAVYARSVLSRLTRSDPVQ